MHAAASAVAPGWVSQSCARSRPCTAVPRGSRTPLRALDSSFGCRSRGAASANLRAAQLLSRMLDQRDDARGHEVAGAHRRAATGDLGDLHLAAGGADLDTPASARRRDDVGAGLTTSVDDDLDPVAPHWSTLVGRTDAETTITQERATVAPLRYSLMPSR